MNSIQTKIQSKLYLFSVCILLLVLCTFEQVIAQDCSLSQYPNDYNLTGTQAAEICDNNHAVQLETVNIPEAWCLLEEAGKLAAGNNKIRVGYYDHVDGIYNGGKWAHPDLDLELKNCKNCEPSLTANFSGHGMTVMGMGSASVNNGLGIVSPAYGVENVAANSSPVISANIQFLADRDCAVTSNTSYYDIGPKTDDIKRTLNKGTVYLYLGGNWSDSEYCGASPCLYASAPGLEDVIVVGATRYDGRYGDPNPDDEYFRGSGGSVGPGITVMAPGGGKTETCHLIFDKETNAPSYKTGSDPTTSKSTGFLAGCVSLIKMANPCLTSGDVKQILIDTAVPVVDEETWTISPAHAVKYAIDLGLYNRETQLGFHTEITYDPETEDPLEPFKDVELIDPQIIDHVQQIYTGENDAYEPSNWFGAGLVDIAAAVERALSFPIDDKTHITPSGANEIWDEELERYDRITVESGGTLTIKNSHIAMKWGGAIIVERGGKLIIDNSELTNGCSSQAWKGIFVEGNGNPTHMAERQSALLFSDNAALLADGPGVVIVKNNSVIENAISGITTRRFEHPQDREYFGGLIKAENSYFRNNYRGIEFMPFNNLQGLLPGQFAKHDKRNHSSIIDCHFEFNSPSTMISPEFFRGISMTSVNDVTIDGCDFSNLEGEIPATPFTQPEALTGIYSDRSGYQVTNSNFFNLIFGIHIENLCEGDDGILVGGYSDTDESLGNVFTDNYAGIYADNASSLEVASNSFDGNNLVAAGGDIGISVQGESLVNIYDNYFFGLQAGVHLRNNYNLANLVQSNILIENDYAILVEGNNGNDELGFLFKCNDMEDSDKADIYFRSFESTPASILTYQGSHKYPANNLFSDFCEDELNIKGTGNKFEYFHRGTTQPFIDRVVPHCTNENLVNLNESMTDGNCNNIRIGIGTIPDWDDIRDIRSEMDDLDMTKDAGQTEELLSALELNPGAVNTIKNIKKAGSLLTKNVLTSFTKTSEISQIERSKTLAANSPLSDQHMLLASENLPASHYQVLYDIKELGGLSDINRLQAELAEFKTSEAIIFEIMIKDAAAANNLEEVEALLLEQETVTSMNQLFGFLLTFNEFSAAEDLLAEDWNSDEAAGLRTLILRAAQEGENAEFSSSESESILAIADSDNPEAGMARALASKYLGVFYKPVIDIPEDMGKSKGKIYPTPTELEESINLNIFPNPADQQTTIFIDKEDVQMEAASIQVIQMSGAVVQIVELEAGQNIAEVNTRTLPGGLYLINLVSESGISIRQSKLMVNH